MTPCLFGYRILNMANRRIIRTPKNVVNPMFFIPDGVEDMEYSQDATGLAGDTVEDDDGEVEIVGPQPAPPTPTKTSVPKAPKPKPKKTVKPKPKTKAKKGDDGGDIAIPRTFKIVTQKINTRTDGSQFVDLVVEVDSIPKATGYEFRVTATATGKTTVFTG